MTPMLMFGIAALAALAATAATVLLLRPHLERLLDELCGSQARAGFWLVVSLLAIAVCSVLAGTATYGYPDTQAASASDSFLGGLTQLRLFLVGLLGSVLVVAFGLVQAIRAFERRATERASFAAANPSGAAPPPPPQPPAMTLRPPQG